MNIRLLPPKCTPEKILTVASKNKIVTLALYGLAPSPTEGDQTPGHVLAYRPHS